MYYSGATKVASNCAYNKDNFCWVRVTSPATGYIKNFECSNPSVSRHGGSGPGGRPGAILVRMQTCSTPHPSQYEGAHTLRPPPAVAGRNCVLPTACCRNSGCPASLCLAGRADRPSCLVPQLPLMQGTQYLVMYPNYQTCRPCTETAPSRAAVAAVAKSLVGKTLSYTQELSLGPSPGGWRWSGINGGSTGYYRCPYSLPQVMCRGDWW